MARRSSQSALSQKILQAVKKSDPKTVKQLVEIVLREDGSVSEKDLMEQIIELESLGRIRFSERGEPVQQNALAYVRSPKSYWYWITLTLTLVTAVTAFTISQDIYPLVYVRYFLGIVFILWLPGYSFIRALFPMQLPLRSSSKELDILMRAVLSIAINIALVPIIGLVLNYTPWGLQFVPMVISLLAFTTVFATVAIIRDYFSQFNKDSQKT